jgi:tRNA 2-thiouridine synthesizing protein A
MSEKQVLDTRGLSCPEPVLRVKIALRQTTGPLEVLVDEGAARGNVSRLALREGWLVTVKEEKEDGIRLLLSKR